MPRGRSLLKTRQGKRRTELLRGDPVILIIRKRRNVGKFLFCKRLLGKCLNEKQETQDEGKCFFHVRGQNLPEDLRSFLNNGYGCVRT